MAKAKSKLMWAVVDDRGCIHSPDTHKTLTRQVAAELFYNRPAYSCIPDEKELNKRGWRTARVRVTEVESK